MLHAAHGEYPKDPKPCTEKGAESELLRACIGFGSQPPSSLLSAKVIILHGGVTWMNNYQHSLFGFLHKTIH